MFFVAPTLLALVVQRWLVAPAIWCLGGLCIVWLMRDPTFDRREFWNAQACKAAIRGIVLRAVPILAGSTALLLIVEPERLLALPRRSLALWGVIMVGYPLLSVYAQEVAFRAFFRHRYRALTTSTSAYILLNAVAFAYAHIIMKNPIAVGFSLIAGVLFAHTYEKSRSTLAVSVEHAIYGCAVFTIGWGWYFVGGVSRVPTP
jgi:hypothetical protein